MDDGKRLEELRAQRELIRKHLLWLDRNIAELESGDPPKLETPDKGSVNRPNDGSDKSGGSDETAEAPSPHLEDEALDETFGRYKAPTANDIQRAKIGCLVLFVLATLLFLFLLFGLPYLLK